MMHMNEIDVVKDAHRGVWESGDYTAVADRYVTPLAEVALGKAAPRPGDALLDVAAGAGNAALPAAQAGATVTALDLAPRLLEIGKDRAVELGLDIDWVEGDAEALPFAPGSFDAVVSVVGVQFAPRHEVVTSELTRVLRPGGRLALCSWTPDGFIGRFLRTVSPRMPKPPAEASPPPLWGDPEHVAALFGEAADLGFEVRTTDFEHESEARFVDFMAMNYGPMVKARERLTELGSWDELRGELIDLCERFDRGEGHFRAPAEYLVATGTRTDS